MEQTDHGNTTQTSAHPAKDGTFTPPRHWMSLSELDSNYWKDAAEQEIRGQEFKAKPIESLEKMEKMGNFGIARREFLTVMGASMAMASAACMRKPVHKIIPYVVKPEEIVPGVPTWYASTCQECSVGCGILAKDREGRPIKLEGNPEHPVNEGALCARGQASLLNLYDPDRLKNPVVVDRASGSFRVTGWDQLDAEIIARLKGVAAKGGKVRVLSAPIISDSTRALVQDFLGSFRDGALVEYEALSFEDIAKGQQESYGQSAIPHYRFDQADVVVSIGADFLGNWISPMEHSAAWAKRRKLEGESSAGAKMSKFYCFETTLTLTGSNADERFAVRPGDEYKVALALVSALVAEKRSRYVGDGNVLAAIKGYSSESVAAQIGHGLTAEKIKEVAETLWQSRGKALVVAGGGASKNAGSLATQVAVNLLNSALEAEGSTIDGSVTQAHSGGAADLSKLVSEMNSGSVDVLIIHRSNPAYASAGDSGFAQALKKVPLVLTTSALVDETSVLVDYVAPDHHYLENWGDAHGRSDVLSLQQPTVAPLHQTRAFQDTLLTWIKGAGGKAPRAAKVIAANGSWYEYLKAYWQDTVFPKYGKALGSFTSFWETTLEKGVLVIGKSGGGRRDFRTASLKAVPGFSEAPSETQLVLYPKISMGDGRSANNPWLQEMPDPISTVTWDNYLNMAPSAAEKLGIAQYDVVEISAGGVAASLPVNIQPGLHPQVVSAAIGYGRERAGKVGTQVGVNVFPFAGTRGGSLELSGAAVKLRRTGKRYELAASQQVILTETHNRPIINDITLAAYRKNPESESHHDPELRMKEVPTIWPKHRYDKPYRWGMAIDLNSCTGCGSCVIACQAENNIPVVGRTQVRNHREMHWIRIDRYYSNSKDQPQVVFQPMLCQHCENAPCETVCPVLATVHSDEGLNEMTYNRCVGTRYCQNNCPYKVRRFNFFDFWKEYQETQNLVWNPDVTVRTRGVMEKCTFCVQRIQSAKSTAKDRGDHVKDGELKTACQQTCPTDAIVFGNINDPGSRVSKLRSDPRAYRVLEVQNTKPSISYLTKVRNRQEESHHGHS